MIQFYNRFFKIVIAIESYEVDVRQNLFTIFSVTTLTILLACSAGSHTSIPSAPSITTQPANQNVAVGQTTTLNVAVIGTAPFSYQWQWNGMVVNGATSDSFTTPPAVPSDNQSTITVTVTNLAGAVISSPAALTVVGGLHPPKAGDLRFKDVDAFPIALQANQESSILGGMTATFQNMVGTPLELSGLEPNVPMDSAWSYVVFNLPDGAPGRKTIYQSDSLANFQSDFIALTPSNSLVASLDFCTGPSDFAWEVVQTSTTGGFLPNSQTLLPADLQVAAVQEGRASRVITAVTMNAGQATYVSYGWQSDTSTVYESSVVTATVYTVSSVATNLAQQGYIITAIGGNTSDGFILVGTRVQGETTPRSLVVWTSTATTIGRGYACVGHIFVVNPNNPAAGTEMWFFEQ